MNEAACWEQLERAFARMLGAQRMGTIEEIALYAADVTRPLGLALARAVHEAKLGPDPAIWGAGPRRVKTYGKGHAAPIARARPAFPRASGAVDVAVEAGAYEARAVAKW